MSPELSGETLKPEEPMSTDGPPFLVDGPIPPPQKPVHDGMTLLEIIDADGGHIIRCND